MDQIDDVTIGFLEETIEIIGSALQRLKKLREKAERDLSLDYKNRRTLLRMSKQVDEIKRGVIG